MTFALSSSTVGAVSLSTSQRGRPDALSLATLERLLDLPKGSARKRRLAVLVVSADQVAGTDLEHGDRLVLEPGARATLGYLLACQSRAGVVLRRLRFRPDGRAVLTPPDEDALPLDDGLTCTVVGTVLAAIRGSDNGDAQVAFAPRYHFDRARPFLSGAHSHASRRQMMRRANSSLIRSALATLQSLPVHGSAAAQAAAATTRLETLGKCLDAVEDERIYRALVREINATLLRTRRGITTTRLWIPLSYEGRRRADPAHSADQQSLGLESDYEVSANIRGNAQRQIFRS